MTQSTERPENVPTGYFWMVGGIAFVLASLVALAYAWPLVIITGAGAWFCFYVGRTRSKRYKAAKAAANR
jgi:Flp pilus assembly protein TadB